MLHADDFNLRSIGSWWRQVNSSQKYSGLVLPLTNKYMRFEIKRLLFRSVSDDFKSEILSWNVESENFSTRIAWIFTNSELLFLLFILCILFAISGNLPFFFLYAAYRNKKIPSNSCLENKPKPKVWFALILTQIVARM